MSSESEVYFGFIDDASWHTLRHAFAAWVIFAPGGYFLSYEDICLGDTNNNVFEYNIVI
jgi:hypothetical protein